MPTAKPATIGTVCRLNVRRFIWVSSKTPLGDPNRISPRAAADDQEGDCLDVKRPAKQLSGSQ